MKENIPLKLVKMLKPFWRHYAVVLLLILVTQLVVMCIPFLFAKMIDANTFNQAILFVAAAFACWLISRTIISITRDRYEVQNIDFDTQPFLNNLSLRKLLNFSVGQHRNENSGIKQHVVGEGQSAIREMVERMIFEITPVILQTVVTTTIITVFSPLIGSFIIICITLYLYLTIKRNISYRGRTLDWIEKRKNQAKIISEFHRNIPFVILESQEDKAITMVRDAQEKNSDMAKKLWTPYVTQSGYLRIIIGISLYGSIGLALYLIFTGQFSKGMFVAFVSWIQQSVGNVEMLAYYQRQFMIYFAQVNKYFELTSIPSDISMAENPILPENLFGKIEFRNVSYSYPSRNDSKKSHANENESVSNLCFTILPGEKIGIVGESGAGKSTLVNLLRRASDPSSGSILIDDYPLTHLDLHWFRSNIGNVEQEVAVFDLSIKENIVFGLNGRAGSITDQDLHEVAKLASIDDFILKLENGFDTMIGERGIKLSGGERQRIAIARALIKNPKILIFDEATSALDAYNEKLVHDSMNQASKGRTTIIIAHRLSTVIDADRIIVMKEGAIDDIGTHVELSERCAEYQKLIKNQIVAF
jgi:ABC-type multidrug transport system fused ATPase/permease subunit